MGAGGGVLPLFSTARKACIETKIHFKSRGTDCKILNIFANSHLMHVISILMDSKHHIDNFQSVLVAKTAKFSMKKNTGKFSVF